MIHAIKSGYSSAVPLSAPSYLPEINEQPVKGIEEISSQRKPGKKGIAEYNDAFEDLSQIQQTQNQNRLQGLDYLRLQPEDKDSPARIEVRSSSYNYKTNFNTPESDARLQNIDGAYKETYQAVNNTAALQADLAAKMFTFIRA